MKNEAFQNLMKKNYQKLPIHYLGMCTIDNKYEIILKWKYNNKKFDFKIIVPLQLYKGKYEGIIYQIQANLKMYVNDNIPFGF